MGSERMDTRIALEKGTKLCFSSGENTTVTYLIQKEIGRGGSCIVYDASYTNQMAQKRLVRIKECYPFKLDIKRDKENRLMANQEDQKFFEGCKQRMKQAFYLCNELFDTAGLTNSISNTLDIYSANETLYIVSTYLQGKPLAVNTPTSLKECISIVKSVAKTVKRIHEKGYLYLDIKPENIFVLDGITELVQLFDFDSLMAISKENIKIEEFDNRISYTNGFAALEQQLGQMNRLGKYTDVFGIGAVLYYLLFGTPPDALNCEWDAEYDFSQFIYHKNQYQDTLFDELTDFFHHTLANYYQDRYQDMELVIQQLEEIEKSADTVVPYVISSKLIYPSMVVGREEELDKIKEWEERNLSNCLFLTGMGGIGKSTLIKEYIVRNKKAYDLILYLYFNETLQKTIADDEQLAINMVKRREEEAEADYFMRKLKALRKLVIGKRVLLVVDNFNGEIDDTFFHVIKVDWRVIFVTRKKKEIAELPTLEINALRNKEDLYAIFEHNLHYEISGEEQNWLDYILGRTAGHTLSLMLIAKQIANSHMTLKEAAALVERNGFSHMAPEKIEYLKDQSLYYETISNIINGMFSFDYITAEKKVILKAISMFLLLGVPIHLFTEMLQLESKDVVNELIRDGFVELSGKQLLLHPVILEIVMDWKLTEEAKTATIKIMEAILKEIQGKSDESEISNLQEFRKWMQLSEQVLSAVERERALKTHKIYEELLYATCIGVTREREDYILEHATYLLNHASGLDEKARIVLYQRIVSTYCEKMELEKAYHIILEAGNRLRKNASNYVKGRYYDMRATYYDTRLNGAYGEDNVYDDIKNMMTSIDKAILCMRKDKSLEGKRFLGKCLLSKAMVLIRCFPKRKLTMQRLLKATDAIVKEYMREPSELQYELLVAKAWYHTMVYPDIELVNQRMTEAYDIAKGIVNTELNIIDDIFVTWANMMLVLQQYEKSLEYLNQAVQICEKYPEVIPYIRKKLDLYTYMIDVYFEMEELEKCRELVLQINKENEVNKELGIVKEIPAELMEALTE